MKISALLHNLIILFLLSFISGSTYAQTDSLGIVEREGKYFVKHQVQKGQGFYAISKKYGVPIDQIITTNPETRSGLNVDQIIYVPLENYKPSGSTPVQSQTPKVSDTREPERNGSGAAKTHTVKPGETLYRIATNYGIAVEELKELNGMKDNSISVGQTLIVSRGSKSAEPPAKPKSAETLPAKPETPSIVAEKITEVPKAKGNEVSEKGICLWDKDNEIEENNRYVALHPNLPAGTIIMVTNPENNKSAFVRITGNTAPTDKGITLKISQGTAQLLRVNANEKTQVVLSYTQP